MKTQEIIFETSLAWKIFSAFASDSPVGVTEEELLAYARNELALDLTSVPAEVLEHVPNILVAFIERWSGWHMKKHFLAGNKVHCFKMFHKYMICKMLHILQSFPMHLLDEKENSTRKLRQIGADRKEPEVSPFTISIQCPPHMLNTIIFSSAGDDVIMKPHLGTPCFNLSTTQLLNWPHVKVKFRTKDICFVRRSATEFVRYLSFRPHGSQRNKENTIEHVETLPRYGRPKFCYSVRLLEAYMKEYLDALKTIKSITPDKLEEIETILVQYLLDVRLIKVNRSIATETVVLFRLCPVPFIRNKKLQKKSEEGSSEEARVGFCEIITPKIELVLLYFSAVQKEASHVCFEYPDEIKESTDSNDVSFLLPSIIYQCTYCEVEFSSENSKKLMLNHLKHHHKTEQQVRCSACKKQYDVLSLTARRWRHKCVASSINPLGILHLS